MHPIRVWLAGGLAAVAAVSLAAQSMVSVAPPGEPGEPLLVEGRILTAVGRPAASAALYVYQTDARGYYAIHQMDERNARLKARFTTDADGVFRFRTIKPGPYPNSGPPAHIHVEVTPSGGRTERYALVFEGDARLSGAIRDDARTRGFYRICNAAKAGDGMLLCRDVTFTLHQ
jgi:protocatechuate 3,4-dioxygenase beta subunit